MPEKEKEITMNPSMTEYFNEGGDPIRPILRWDTDHKKVVKVGEENIQENIDKAAYGMSLSEQLQRLARGDVSVLRTEEPFYGDVSDVPDTYGETVNAMNAQLANEVERQAQEKAAKLAEAQAKLKEAQENLQNIEKEDK